MSIYDDLTESSCPNGRRCAVEACLVHGRDGLLDQRRNAAPPAPAVPTAPVTEPAPVAPSSEPATTPETPAAHAAGQNP